MSAAESLESIRMVAAPGVRRTLTPPGDIRAEVDFQNDINRLLARIEESAMPWRPAAELCMYAVGPLPEGYRGRNSVKPPLRVYDGGRMTLPTRQSRGTAMASQTSYAATAPATAIPSFSRR